MADTKKPFEEVSAEDAQAMFANAAKAMGGRQGRSEGFRRVSIPVSEPVRPEPLPKEEPEKKKFVIDPEAIEPKTESGSGSKIQSERKAKYLRKRQKEEDESVPISKKKLAARQDARLAAEAAAEAAAVAAAAEPRTRERIAEEPYEEPEDVRIYEAPRTREEDSYDEPDTGYDFGATTIIPSAVTFDYGDEYYEDEYEDGDYEYSDTDLEEEVAFSALEQALNRHKEVYGDTRKTRRRFHDYGFGMGITFDGPSYDDYDDEDDI